MVIALELRQLRAFGVQASEVARDVGPSAGYFACLGLVSARLKRPWQWVSGVILFSGFIFAFFAPTVPGDNAKVQFSADLAHLLAFPLGWLSSFMRSPSKLKVKNKEAK